MTEIKCAVKGMLVAPTKRSYGAMCGHVFVGGNECGFKGKCEHQHPVDPTQESAATTPVATTKDDE